MRLSYYLSSMLHIFTILFVMLLGISFVSLPMFPKLRFLCYELIESQSIYLVYGGGALVGASCLLGIAFWAIYHKGAVTLEMGDIQVDIDAKLIERYVKSYWQQTFEESNSTIQVFIHSGQQIEIVSAKLPKHFNEERHLPSIEKGIKRLLLEKFGYQHSFLFSIRF